MGVLKKRSETTSLRSLSLRSDSASAKTSQQATQHVNVGCMSGIFRFVSNYHTHRKFLTSGKKHERKSATTIPPNKTENATSEPESNEIISAEVTLEMPRSPIIPAELRRQSLPSPESPREMPRQIGLNAVPVTYAAPVEAAAEKKRRLLGALERCDEDLQALKRIIEEIRSVQTPPMTPSRGDGDERRKGGAEEVAGSEEPSPVSVIDHHRAVARSPNMSCSIRIIREISADNKDNNQQIQQGQQKTRRRVREEANAVFFVRNKAAMVLKMAPTVSTWSSATQECVIQVCKAMECGRIREVEVLVWVLEDLVFRDLLHEFVNDITCFNVSCGYDEVWRRKLSF